ncbi:MAG: hypothetical protein ABI480_12175 [Chitinophagaceae bacterium]
MKQKLFLITLAVSLFALVSCKKGDDGPPGTANVKFSEWFTPDVYKKDTTFGIYGFSYIKPAAGITQAVLDSGTVLVFGKLLGYNPLEWPTDQVGQLPITLTYVQGTTMTDTWSASEKAGNLKIRFVNDKNYYNSISNAHKFRYIIIPGGVSTARMASYDYHDICKQYNIPE